MVLVVVPLVAMLFTLLFNLIQITISSLVAIKLLHLTFLSCITFLNSMQFALELSQFRLFLIPTLVLLMLVLLTTDAQQMPFQCCSNSIQEVVTLLSPSTLATATLTPF